MKLSRTTTALSVLLLAVGTAVPASAQGRRTKQGPKKSSVARPIRWAPDAQHLLIGRDWVDPISGDKSKPVRVEKIEKAKKPTREFQRAIVQKKKSKVPAAALSGKRDRSMPGNLPRIPMAYEGARFSSDMKIGACIIGDDLWGWQAGKDAQLIGSGFEGARRFELSADGSTISFIQAYNLHLASTATGKRAQLTEDGSENIFYGELDWVYQEEVYGRGNFKATWWAPTSQYLAWLRIDENGVDTFMVVDHIPDALEVATLKYPKSGTINPRADLFVTRAKDQLTTKFDLSKYPAKEEILIQRVGWTPKGDKVIFMVQNREQTWLDLNFGDPDSGQFATIIHEDRKDGWIEIPAMPQWLADGTFLWQSDRTGFRHLYRYAADGKLIATVSKGDWRMERVIRLDEGAGWIAFYGDSKNYGIGRQAYRATLDGKSLVQLTKGRGTHQVSFNKDGSMLLDQFMSLANPGEQWLRKADGSDVRQTFKKKAKAGANLAQWKQIKARDGELLDISYQLPKGFDAQKKYPVWINTYSGPDAASIRDSWRGERGASDWYINLQVNVRSASSRGMKYTKACYRQFGVQELRDIEDAIDWLCNNHAWADKDRVGITGWSYGGFMTAFALTHSKKFKCGIAGAGVYDWRLYDTIYTERYMATPQNNPEGYDASSVVKAAKHLHGELLIVHGTMDDNVHMQNAIQLVNELQKAGKTNFSFMLYPQSAHGVRSSHLGALRKKFMREHL